MCYQLLILSQDKGERPDTNPGVLDGLAWVKL
jgi:hypothetical protein